MDKDHKLFFYDRCGMTRAAVTGQKTSTRIILGCSPDTPTSEVQASGFSVGETVPIMMSYRQQLHFSKRAMDAMMVQPHSGIWKPEYREEIKGRGWDDKYCVLPELMLFHAEITGVEIQHLHDITDEEIATEGLQVTDDGCAAFRDEEKEFCGLQVYRTPRDAYRAFIELSEGEHIWEYNPWVLAVRFRSLDGEIAKPRHPLNQPNESPIKMRTYTITHYGKTYEVILDYSFYTKNMTLAVRLFSRPSEEDMPAFAHEIASAGHQYVEPFGNVTVNLPESASLPSGCQFVDTEKLPGIDRWLTENGIAVPVGITVSRGRCSFPAFKFTLPNNNTFKES